MIRIDAKTPYGDISTIGGRKCVPDEPARTGERKRIVITDKSLNQAWICLHCTKETCKGTEACFKEEMKKRGKDKTKTNT